MNHWSNFRELKTQLEDITGRVDMLTLNQKDSKVKHAKGETFVDKGVEHDLVLIFKLNDKTTVGFSFTNYKGPSENVLVEIGLRDLDTLNLQLTKPLNLREFRTVFKDLLSQLDVLKKENKHLENVELPKFVEVFQKYFNEESLDSLIKSAEKPKRNFNTPPKIESGDFETVKKNPVQAALDDLTTKDCLKIYSEFKILKETGILPENSLLQDKCREIAKIFNTSPGVFLDSFARDVGFKLADKFIELSEKIEQENALNSIMKTR